MSRIAYVDGRYVPHGSAAVHVERYLAHVTEAA